MKHFSRYIIYQHCEFAINIFEWFFWNIPCQFISDNRPNINSKRGFFGFCVTEKQKLCIHVIYSRPVMPTYLKAGKYEWGISSNGRARALHARGSGSMPASSKNFSHHLNLIFRVLVFFSYSSCDFTHTKSGKNILRE